jgi:hypothetical protein
MDNESEIVRLLTEIRDMGTNREQQYKDYLANQEQAYARQIEAAHKRAKQSARYQWIALFVIVYCAAYFALLSSHVK